MSSSKKIDLSMDFAVGVCETPTPTSFLVWGDLANLC